MGHCVQSAGDVNGDGFADVIVGAPSYGTFLPNEGKALVFHGSASGLSASAAWDVAGGTEQIEYGLSVSGAGDVNGDGYDDVIVGAPRVSHGETDEGRAYLYYGSPAGLSVVAGWTAESNLENARFGHRVSRVGDINRDGFLDVIVGALRYTNGETDEGAAFVFHGSAAGLSAVPNWSAEGNQPDVQYGAALGCAGDVNADGFDDAIVSARLYSNSQGSEGRVFVYHGSGTGLPPAASWMTESNQTGAWYGWSVSTAGDVNGDGVDDVVIGALLFNNPEVDEGQLYAYHGSATGLSTTANWTVDSNQASAFLGGSVAGVGDVNLDGYDDVVGSAYQYTSGETLEGTIFGYLGSPTGLATAPAWCVESNNLGARFGYSAAGAGDVNGDGQPDVIVGAPQYSNGSDEEGAAFVFHASPVNTPPAAVCRDLLRAADATCAAVIAPVEVDGGSSDADGDPLSFSLSPPGPFGPGATVVTLTVTDQAGASDSCTATVTVEDIAVPSVSCPAGTVVEADASCQAVVPDVLGAVTAGDNCTAAGALLLVQDPVAGTMVGPGLHAITVTVTDASGNGETCQSTLTVVETTPPEIVCPPAQTLSANEGCAYVGPIGTATASDNCSAAGAIVLGSDAPASFPPGLTVVTWTARDEAGNVGTCQQEVTVVDRTAPAVTCPADMTGPCTGPEGAAVELAAVATDACDASPEVAFEPASGSVFPAGTTMVTCTATDAAGNASTCTFTVTVTCGGQQRPGDCNQDGRVDISDAVCLLGYLFLGQPGRLPCGEGEHHDRGNLALLDWQPDGEVDLADAVGLLSFLFQGTRAHPLDPGDGSCVALDGCADGPLCP